MSANVGNETHNKKAGRTKLQINHLRSRKLVWDRIWHILQVQGYFQQLSLTVAYENLDTRVLIIKCRKEKKADDMMPEVSYENMLDQTQMKLNLPLDW